MGAYAVIGHLLYVCRDHFVNAPNQWETTLHCNVVSHWLGAYTKWPLCMLKKRMTIYFLWQFLFLCCCCCFVVVYIISISTTVSQHNRYRYFVLKLAQVFLNLHGLYAYWWYICRISDWNVRCFQTARPVTWLTAMVRNGIPWSRLLERWAASSASVW